MRKSIIAVLLILITVFELNVDKFYKSKDEIVAYNNYLREHAVPSQEDEMVYQEIKKSFDETLLPGLMDCAAQIINITYNPAEATRVIKEFTGHNPEELIDLQ